MIITQGLGSHFDPDIAQTFLRIADRFHEIAMAFKDKEGGNSGTVENVLF